MIRGTTQRSKSRSKPGDSPRAVSLLRTWQQPVGVCQHAGGDGVPCWRNSSLWRGLRCHRLGLQLGQPRLPGRSLRFLLCTPLSLGGRGLQYTTWSLSCSPVYLIWTTPNENDRPARETIFEWPDRPWPRL